MSLSSKKDHRRSWPRSLYLEDDDRTDRQYQQFQYDWEHGQTAQGFNIFDSLSPHSGYRPLNDSPQFLNLSPPPEPFMLRHARKDPYEKSRARYESKPKLGTIPERGAKGIAAAGRYPGTLTASEIAEVDSHFGQSKVTMNNNGGTVMSELGRGDTRSVVSGFDAPPSYKSDDNNNNWWRRKNMSPHKMKICIGVIVALVAIGLVVSAVAIYFSLAAMNFPEDKETVRYELTMTLENANFSLDLQNNKSSRFLELQKNICDTMNGILSDILLCQLDTCREGSVVTDFTLGFSKQTREDLKKDNAGKYSDFLITTITKAWTDANSPDNVSQFVHMYGPVPQSLRIVNNPQRTDPATPVTTMTVPGATTSTAQHVQTTQTTERVTTSLPTTTVSSTQAMETTAHSGELTTSTTIDQPSTAVPSTMSSTAEPGSTGALSSTAALTVSASLSTSSVALTFESTTVSGTAAPTLESTSALSTAAPTLESTFALSTATQASTGENLPSTTAMPGTTSQAICTGAPTTTDPTSTHILSTAALSTMTNENQSGTESVTTS